MDPLRGSELADSAPLQGVREAFGVESVFDFGPWTLDL